MDKIQFDIHTISTRSKAMGAMTALGLVSEDLKDRLSHPENLELHNKIRHEFKSLTQEYDNDVAFLSDAKGQIITYYNQLKPDLVSHENIAFRPYWQLAMKGVSTVYPAVGITDRGRGFYIAAPVYQTLENDSDVTGVLSARMNAKILDETLLNYRLPAMIVSIDGVVFSSNQPDWILKLAHPLTAHQHQKLQQIRQFGDLFQHPESSQILPFDIKRSYSKENQHVTYNGEIYSVTSIPLDWFDPQGQWHLVVLDNTSTWLSWWERSVVVISITVLMFGLYMILKLRNRIEQNALDAVIAQQKIQQRAKQHLRKVTDSLPLAIFQITSDENYEHWSFTYASAKCQQILGLDPLEIMTNYRMLESHVYPDDSDFILDSFYLALEQKTDFEFEHRIVRDGEIVWVKANARCHQVSDKEWVWNGYWRDVTEQHEQTRQLQEAKIQAEEAVHAKSLFLANMSHEIRTPMNAVIGLAYLALKTQLDAKQRDYLSKIHQAGSSLLGIINDILDVSKIEANQMHLECVPFSLDDVLANLSVVSAQRAHEKGLELLFDLPADVPRRLYGDPLRLGQVLTNLIVNAIKFTESGFVHLQIRLISLANEEAELRFSIRDTGIGMNTEQISRLFQAFSQADDSTTRRYGGTGLGLTIVKYFVEQMGGRVTLHSEPGKGSEFVFNIRLPVDETSETNAVRVPTRLNGLKIMVVDDNALATDILLDALRPLPVYATACSKAVDALKNIHEAIEQNDPFDLVMTDWQMPEMDGLQLANAIKGQPHAPQVVMVTAYEFDNIQQSAEDAGVVRFLAKPLSQSNVVDCLMHLYAPEEGGTVGEMPQMSLPHFQQARVLLVEDNAVNQQIASELLSACNINVDIANHGEEALTKIFAEAPDYYDLVLMDLQMPVMDGHEATQAIRHDSRFDALPIVAMTAHALEEERERCLNEGMVDHVTKPIDPNQFYQMLNRYLNHRRSGFHQAPANLSNFHFRLDDVDTQSAILRIGGNVTFYQQILRQYRTEHERSADELRECLNHQDFEGARLIAHSLKGVSANIGAGKVAGIAAELERNLMQPGPADSQLMQQLTRLDMVLRNLCDQIAHLPVEENDQIPKETVTKEKVAELIDLIQNFDGQALDRFAALEPGLKSILSEETCEQIRNDLQSFDFELAEELLKPALEQLAES